MTTSDHWHASRELLQRYAAGHLDATAAWSVEQHVTTCHHCRALVAEDPATAPAQGGPLVPTMRLDAIWAEVEATVDAPAPTPVEQVLLWAGVPDHVARLLAATPALTVPWLLAVALVLSGAAAIARFDAAGPLLFLTIAPLVPLAGVGLAFGPWSDPAYEIALAAPVRAGRLLLIRAAAVTGTSFGLAAVAALLLPGHGVMIAAWVLPGLAVTATMLAVSTWWGPAASAMAVGAGWVACVVLIEAAASTSLATFAGVGQALALVLTALAAGVVMTRYETFDTRRSA